MSITAPLKIGDIDIPNRVFLAPMSGVSDEPFRRLANRYGAGLVFSEMIASQAMIRHTRQSVRRARPTGPQDISAVQLAGTDPEVMAEAARINADMGAHIIDINFGCPAKKIVRKASGSALMRDETLAADIMAAVVAAVEVPVTVKMRTGWDDDSRNAPHLARIAEDCGIRMITVHGRTRCQFYTGKADWRFIRAVKQAVSIPVIANGDIGDYEAAVSCLAQSGADGIMIGRGAQGRPWFPGDVARFLATGVRPQTPPEADRHAVMAEHFDAMLSHYGVENGIRVARKHIGWYAAGLADAAAFRNAVNNTMDPAVVHDAMERFFGAAGERSAA